jgi:hypothetical protein
MKKAGLGVALLVVGLTVYNTWQIQRLAAHIEQRRSEASAAARLERALTHTRRARSLLSRNETHQASEELDIAIQDVTVAAARSRAGGRSFVRSMRQGVRRMGQRVRSVLKDEG